MEFREGSGVQPGLPGEDLHPETSVLNKRQRGGTDTAERPCGARGRRSDPSLGARREQGGERLSPKVGVVCYSGLHGRGSSSPGRSTPGWQPAPLPPGAPPHPPTPPHASEMPPPGSDRPTAPPLPRTGTPGSTVSRRSPALALPGGILPAPPQAPGLCGLREGTVAILGGQATERQYLSARRERAGRFPGLNFVFCPETGSVSVMIAGISTDRGRENSVSTRTARTGGGALRLVI